MTLVLWMLNNQNKTFRIKNLQAKSWTSLEMYLQLLEEAQIQAILF